MLLSALLSGLVLVLVGGWSWSFVNAHGMVTVPQIRLLSGDAGNGFTFARSRAPIPSDGCQNLPRESPWSHVMTGGSAKLSYIITAAHRGGCSVYISKYDGNWQMIGSDPNCGQTEHSGVINMNIPSGDYEAVLRWEYVSDNGSGEMFENCMDVKVSSAGTNNYDLPADPSMFQKCAASDDMTCTGVSDHRGWSQCGPGVWVPKLCPFNTACYQIVESNPGRGQLGSIECGEPLKGGGGSSSPQISSVSTPVPAPPTSSSSSSSSLEQIQTTSGTPSSVSSSSSSSERMQATAWMSDMDSSFSPSSATSSSEDITFSKTTAEPETETTAEPETESTVEIETSTSKTTSASGSLATITSIGGECLMGTYACDNTLSNLWYQCTNNGWELFSCPGTLSCHSEGPFYIYCA